MPSRSIHAVPKYEYRSRYHVRIGDEADEEAAGRDESQESHHEGKSIQRAERFAE